MTITPLNFGVPQKFDGKISLKLYHNVKDDVILNTFQNKYVWSQILIKEFKI